MRIVRSGHLVDDAIDVFVLMLRPQLTVKVSFYRNWFGFRYSAHELLQMDADAELL